MLLLGICCEHHFQIPFSSIVLDGGRSKTTHASAKCASALPDVSENILGGCGAEPGRGNGDVERAQESSTR